MALVDLSGVGGGLPRATPAEVVQVKFKSNNLTWTTSARVGEVHLRYCAIYIRVESLCPLLKWINQVRQLHLLLLLMLILLLATLLVLLYRLPSSDNLRFLAT